MTVVMECDEPSKRKRHSKYEKDALRQIHAWKSPKRTWLDSITDVVSWPFTKAFSFLEGTPVWSVVAASFSGVLTLINSWSQWSVQADAIIAEYQAGEGPEVRILADIQELDLSAVDRAIGMLDVKYEGIALAQGAATNAPSAILPAAAIAAIPADVAALLGLCLRAIGEYATYCGFDVRDERERLFALQILAYASSPSDAAKAVVMAQLIKVARDAALKKSWEHLSGQILVQAAQELAKAVSVRLTKAKLAQIVPVVGIIAGGAFNAYYADKVCRAAFYLYRERFLAAKYGVEDIEETVAPAKDVVPDFTKTDELPPKEVLPPANPPLPVRKVRSGKSEELARKAKAKRPGKARGRRPPPRASE